MEVEAALISLLDEEAQGIVLTALRGVARGVSRMKIGKASMGVFLSQGCLVACQY